jgi:pSer/pThr/pTyr-binding forkhead associated (FHA) protein
LRTLLELRSGPNAGTKVALQPGQPLRFGRRAEANHSFPNDKAMSGLHFAIQLDEKGCRLVDLNSSNGTFVKGTASKTPPSPTATKSGPARQPSSFVCFATTRLQPRNNKAPRPSLHQKSSKRPNL